MQKAIVYCSQTGFTEKYAKWLAEDFECKAVPYAERRGVNLASLDVLVFCSWFHAASIKGVKWVKQVMAQFPDLHVVVLATGATPPPDLGWTDEDEIEQVFRRIFPEAEYPTLPYFYCHGGFDFDRLGAADKVAMRMFFHMLEKKVESDPKAKEMFDVMQEGFDGTDRKYLKPVLEYISGLEASNSENTED